MINPVRVFRGLPGKNSLDKLFYALYRIFYRYLYFRDVVDRNGIKICHPGQPRCLEKHNRPDRKIICTTGFGHTGSGAIVDLLSEYDGVDVLAYIDINGSLRESGENSEFLLLRHYGGLLHLESPFTSTSLVYRDAAVRMFLRLIGYLYEKVGGSYNDDFLQLTREFLSEIIAWKGASSRFFLGYDYSPQLSIFGDADSRLLLGEAKKIFYLKDLSIAEYRHIAKRYIRKYLDIFSGKETLVLDQALFGVSSEVVADRKRLVDYLGEFKQIVSVRDPRDVYVTARILGEEFIPEDPEHFVDFYLHSLNPYRCVRDENLLLVRFEDLVLNYNLTVSRIERFLGFDNNRHVRDRAAFDPNVSIKNIGLYKTYQDKKSIRFIEDNLGEFLYDRKLTCPCFAGGESC